MDAEGVYGFVLTEGTCHDTVYISRFESTLDAACNNPITGPNVIVTDPGSSDCLLCIGAGVVVDGDLTGYVSLNTSLSITGATTLIAVRDTSQDYPAGRRTGFVVQSLGGLLSATLLSNLEIRTYLDGVLQETATVSGNVLEAGALTGDAALQRLSFVTTLPFDEVELVATATLNLLTEFRVYYAFEEPGSGCPTLDGESCAEGLHVQNTTYCGQLSYERTGIEGVVCVDCSLDNLGNLIDGNTSNYATIQLTVGVGASGQVSVYTRQIMPAGYTAGFVISGPVNLLDLSVLGGLWVKTYLNGVEQDAYLASGGLLQVQVLDASTGLGQLSFVTTEDFDEVQLVVDGLVTALSTVEVYYAYVRRDTDGDGAPDCVDKCCSGDDNLDTNGNGVPNACDPLPIAVDDGAVEDTAVDILILGNDSFGDDGPGDPALEVISGPSNGTVSLNDNGTPADPTDDYLVYTPAADFNGADLFSYRICDSSNDCDTAIVNITVNPVDDLPIANDDVASLDEDAGATNITVLTNDDFGGDGATAITIVTPPTNGVATVNDNGTPTDPTDDYLVYTPDANYNGPDQITYQICDADGDCDQAVVNITVNPVDDLPVANDDVASLDEDAGATNITVLTNDDFGGDGASITAITITIPPTNGVATVNDNGTPADPTDDYLVYTPNANYNGPDQITYQICDADGDCDQAVVNITVNAINDAPIAINNTASIPEGTTAMIPVLDNDTDVEGELDTTSIVIITPPNNGTATPNLVTGIIEYVPDNNFFGIDTFSYAVCDLGTPGLCDTALVIITINAVNVRLALKMRMQGSLYSSPDSLMRDDLRIQNRLPSLEPYTAIAPAFIHVNGGGGEMVTNTASVFANYGPNSIVDWVFVELRDSANIAQVVATRSALLQRDGDVVDVDGTSLLVFSSSLPASYAVAIRHRNHLGSMTESPIALLSTGTNIDFTNTATPLFDDGTNLNGLEQITIDGKYALWAGNVNTNRSVVFAGQNNDKDPIFNQVDQAPGNIFKSQTYIFNGYHLGDVNLSGSAVFAGQNNDVDPIFNNVDGHPRNIFKSQTFIIREQLAH